MYILKMISDDINGATAVEYGLIIAFIAGAALTTITGIGGHLKDSFANTSSSFKAAAP